MACDRLRELALLDVDDGLAADERAELDAHLAGCAECRAARDAARKVASGVRQIPVPPVPLGFSERTLQRYERAQSVDARPRVRLARFAAAAALLAAAAVFWIERERASAPAPEDAEVASQPPEEAERRFAADAEKKNVESLADGASAVAPVRKQAPQAEEKTRADAEGEKSPPPPGSVAPPVAAGAPAEGAADLARAEGGLNERDKNLKDQGERSDEERRKPGAAGAGGADDAGKAGVATKLEEQKENAGLAAAAPAFDELVRDLARGTPAEALHKIGALADAGRDGEFRQEKWAEKAESPTGGAEKAKAAPVTEAAADDMKKSPEVAPPPLRFVRAHGAATRVADLIGVRGEQLARDDAGRFVVELTEDEAKALETRLAAAGVKVETVVASDWLAALRESELRARMRPVVAEGHGAKPPATEPKGAPTKAPGTAPAGPTNGKSRGATGAPAKETPAPQAPPLGAAKRGSGDTKPPPRVRWFLLAGE